MQALLLPVITLSFDYSKRDPWRYPEDLLSVIVCLYDNHFHIKDFVHQVVHSLLKHWHIFLLPTICPHQQSFCIQLCTDYMQQVHNITWRRIQRMSHPACQQQARCHQGKIQESAQHEGQGNSRWETAHSNPKLCKKTQKLCNSA